MKAIFTALGIAAAVSLIYAACVAFLVVISRRSRRLWAMMNQLYSGTPTSRRQVVLPNVSQFLTAGQPILVGTEPGVTLDAYQSNFSGCTVLFNGSFLLTVIGRSANSPLVTAQVNPGDLLYASPNTGTFDATTNVTYGFSIDKNSAGVLFGRLDPSQAAILAGVTNTAAGVQI